jgi:signal transduction histidine kinase
VPDDDPTPTDVILAANLAPFLTEAALREVMTPFGAVLACTLLPAPATAATRRALVRYADAGIVREPVDLMALLAEETARTQATLSVDEGAADGAFTVPGDARLLRRLARNLLENARRHGAGSVVEVTLTRSGNGPTFDVLDRGPGVPEAERERIFEPFHRLAGHGEASGGVGLGLALVRQIARRHGATVTCLPRDGGGSRFSVRFGAAPVGT